MIAYRHADPRFPFLWEGADQPPARWHDDGEGPVHYLSDTPDGAWAEFLRHEEISDPADVAAIRRALWAVDVGEDDLPTSRLPIAVQTGGPETHERCRREARRIRARGGSGLVARSAALLPRSPSGFRVDGGLRPGPPHDAHTVVLFGPRPDLVGWAAAGEGRPRPDLLGRVRSLPAPSSGDAASPSSGG